MAKLGSNSKRLSAVLLGGVEKLEGLNCARSARDGLDGGVRNEPGEDPRRVGAFDKVWPSFLFRLPETCCGSLSRWTEGESGVVGVERDGEPAAAVPEIFFIRLILGGSIL